MPFEEIKAGMENALAGPMLSASPVLKNGNPTPDSLQAR